MKKRGQITIFVVLGILILFISGVLIYYNSLSKRQISSEIMPIASESLFQKSFKDYVNNCLKNTVLDGLEMMRLQGGYIYAPSLFPSTELENNNTFGYKETEKKLLKQEGKVDIPFWILKQGPYFPSRYFMEEELKSYTESQIGFCLNDFSVFKEKGYNVYDSFIDINIEIGKTAEASMFYPITVKIGNISYQFDNFSYSAPINLEQISDIAARVSFEEDLTSFLEEDIMNFVALYSGLSSDKLPPLSKTMVNFDCSHTTWNDAQVKSLLKQVIQKGMSYEKIKNTDYKKEIASFRLFQATISQFEHNIGIEGSAKNIKVVFEFPDELDFIKYDVKPSEGPGIEPPDMMRSKNIPFLPQMCTFEYQYKYDIEFPLIVRVIDKNSPSIDPVNHLLKKENPFEFRFPIWVFICGNNPRYCVELPDYMKEAPEISKEIRDVIGAESMFCDETQKKSKTASIKVFDSGTKEALSNVDVSYSCAGESCYIGKTFNGELKSSFPVCNNGLLEFFRSDYSPKKEVQTIDSEKELSREFYLDRLNGFSYEFRMVDTLTLIKSYKNNNKDYLILNSQDLSDEATVFISASGPSKFNLIYPNNNVSSAVKISKGDYDLSITSSGKLIILPFFSNELNQYIGYNQQDPSAAYEDILPSNIINLKWHVSDEDMKSSKIIFPILFETLPGIRTGLNNYQSSIFDKDQNIKAWLLYQGQLINGECKNMEIIQVSAAQISSSGECMNAEYIEIPKSDYEKLLTPVFK